MALVAVSALVVSACAAGINSIDEGEVKAVDGTTTTQPSSSDQSQESTMGATAPSTIPDTGTAVEGSDPQVTEPSATDQPRDSSSGAVHEGTTTTTPAPAPDSGGYSGPLGDLVAIAVADLAGRLGVPSEQIAVVSAESIVWPDGSLGCPQPDMSYTQVQVDGSKIVLSVDGGTYSYHSGGSRDPFLCVPTKAGSGSGTTDQTLPGTTDPNE